MLIVFFRASVALSGESRLTYLEGAILAQICAPSTVQSRVAYQGMPGAYSESAARKACPEAEPLPCDQFEVAFQALAQWLADTAVLPIENSLGGSIHTVFDLLIRQTALLPLMHGTV